MNKTFELAQELLKNPKGKNLFLLEKFFNLAISFNTPHGFKFKKISDTEVRVLLPHKFLNLNHLNGLHACALATVGEYAAGLLVAKNFGIGKYRLIMGKMEVEYFYQGRFDVIGSAKLSKEEIEKYKAELEENGIINIPMLTKIEDEKLNHIADVTTHWQLKSWETVKSK